MCVQCACETECDSLCVWVCVCVSPSVFVWRACETECVSLSLCVCVMLQPTDPLSADTSSCWLSRVRRARAHTHTHLPPSLPRFLRSNKAAAAGSAAPYLGEAEQVEREEQRVQHGARVPVSARDPWPSSSQSAAHPNNGASSSSSRCCIGARAAPRAQVCVRSASLSAHRLHHQNRGKQHRTGPHSQTGRAAGSMPQPADASRSVTVSVMELLLLLLLRADAPPCAPQPLLLLFISSL